MFSKTFLPIYQTTRYYIPGDSNLHSAYRENLKFQISGSSFKKEHPLSTISGLPQSSATKISILRHLVGFLGQRIDPSRRTT
jgi:hypothetical protein